MNESVECLGGESSGCFAESIEDALDVADRMAEETTERQTHEEYRDFISESDAEMDYRAEEAVKAALHRAKVCKKPIARYDMDTKRAYIEYPNGERKYVEQKAMLVQVLVPRT